MWLLCLRCCKGAPTGQFWISVVEQAELQVSWMALGKFSCSIHPLACCARRGPKG